MVFWYIMVTIPTLVIMSVLFGHQVVRGTSSMTIRYGGHKKSVLENLLHVELQARCNFIRITGFCDPIFYEFWLS
jgi:hypothetical protein